MDHQLKYLNLAIVGTAGNDAYLGQTQDFQVTVFAKVYGRQVRILLLTYIRQSRRHTKCSIYIIYKLACVFDANIYIHFDRIQDPLYTSPDLVIEKMMCYVFRVD